MEQLLNIVQQFDIKGVVDEVKPLGNGLINDTYKVTTKEALTPDYVLQHINNDIFQDVDMLMDNILAVTAHIRKKLEANNTADIDRKVLSFIPNKNTQKYYYKAEDGKYWRIMYFIPDAITKEAVTPDSSYDVGIAFGNFQAMLADIPVELGETIPDFHNMEFRVKQLHDAIKDNLANRVDEVADILKEIEEDIPEMCKGEILHREGKLPKRICHCDTKVNNVMFDKDGNVLCVIDLDTVMPNFVFSDTGDFLRYAANTGKEDDENLDNVNFNMEIFKAFTKGYLKSGKSFLLPIEIENLPYAALRFPFMQTIRFLADYLNGDTYYKIKYPLHNLVRTKAQFKLYKSAKALIPEMQAFIKEELAKL